MKKFALLIILTLFIGFNVSSQSCLPEGITFTTQEQIDNFQTNYPGCTEIEGDVTISGNNILNLNGLNVLVSVGSNVWVFGNGNLKNFTGLYSLKSVGGSLNILFNSSLKTLSGLLSLTTVGGELNIVDNPSLENLSGLENLTFVAGKLDVSSNSSLNSLMALSQLTSINGMLWITNNTVLTSISGLENINFNGFTSLSILGNPHLSECSVQSVCNYIINPIGPIDISDNDTGCNSKEEVEAACNAVYSCLPEGITFTTQEEIDNFQTNHPGCSEIDGNVLIMGNNITNLNGLSVLESIGGFMEIKNNTSLTSLSGLEALATIGSDFNIDGNNALSETNGLNSLQLVGGSFTINDNPELELLTGLEELEDIGGSFTISTNTALINFNGLETLSSIGADLYINNNSSLTSLSGLSGVNTIGNLLLIGYNDLLTSLSGINNIDPNSIMDLSIYGNGLLSGCDVVSICEYLAAPNGTISIHDNALGCTSIEEVEASCVALQSCLQNGITFTTQDQIDNFQTNYPLCTEIEGDVIIIGATNLNGLNVLTAIGGKLIIESGALTDLAGLDNLTTIAKSLYIHSYSLTSLTGLESLTSIGWYMNLYANNNLINLEGLNGLVSIGSEVLIHVNENLINLTGLESLTTVGGDLNIGNNPSLENLSGLENLSHVSGWLGVYANGSLNSLSALSNLTSISGEIWIRDNPELTSISGIKNIDHGGITNLSVFGNHNLSECAIESVCNYIISPNGPIDIYDNETGCNSVQEVEEDCQYLSVDQTQMGPDVISISPNPFNHETNIQFNLPDAGYVNLEILDVTGRKIKTLQSGFLNAGENQLVWDATAFKGGLYFLKIQTNRHTEVRKLLLLE